MSERHKPHNGRDRSGHFKVRRVDADDLLTEPEGVEYLKDDVRLGGAVEDVGVRATEKAEEVTRLIEDNREGVNRLVGREPDSDRRRRRGR